MLFYDRRLSITNTVACTSCHLQSHGFASSSQFDVGAIGVPLKRSSIALANVRYNLQHRWFSDMRVESLTELILEPLQNPEELGSSLPLLENKLRATSFYPPLFAAAFGTPEITSDRVARALAQFLQSLISYRAKVDQAVNPMNFDTPWDPAAVLNAQELRGFDLYMNNCSICHEVQTGINIWQANNGIDAVTTDPGTTNLAMQRDGSEGVFRPASLRNVAVTGPYMHDGRFATLRNVIDHYDQGVKNNRFLDSILKDPATGGPRRLNLGAQDKDALEAFLNTFTDTALLNDPKYADPF